mgnify:CR=1 FL=1
MKKNRFIIDGHQDIAYSILANKRPLDTNDPKYMITLKETLKSKLGLIFSTILFLMLKETRDIWKRFSNLKNTKRYLKITVSFIK